jgi:hypothetical protein
MHRRFARGTRILHGVVKCPHEAAMVDKEPAPKGADSSEEVTLLRNEVMESKSQLGKKDTQDLNAKAGEFIIEPENDEITGFRVLSSECPFCPAGSSTP